MSQTVELGVRLTGETDDYVSNFERASAATDTVTQGWDNLRTQSAAVTEGVGAIAAGYTSAIATLDGFGIATDDIVKSITESTLAQEAFGAATSVAEGLLGALGVQADGYSEILDGAKGLQAEFGEALVASSKGATDAGVQLAQMAQSLRFTGIASEFASGMVGKLKLAFLGLFAVFAVISIAKDLYEESEAIQKVVSRIVTMFKLGWSYIQEANDILVAAIETKFRVVVQVLYPIFAQFAQNVGTILSYIPGLEGVGEKLTAFATELRKRLEDTRSFEDRLTAIRATAAATRAQAVADGAQRLLDIESNFANKKVAAAADAQSKLAAIADAGDKLQREVAAAYGELRRQSLEIASGLLRDALQREQTDLQRSFQLKLIDERAYVEASTAIRTAAAQAELTRIAQQQAELTARRDYLVGQQRVADKGGDRQALLTIEKEIIAIEIKRDALLGREQIAQRNLLDIGKQRTFELDSMAQKQLAFTQQLQDQTDTYKRGLDQQGAARAFEISLIGKTSDQQAILTARHAAEVELERVMIQLRANELEQIRALTAGDQDRFAKAYETGIALSEQASAARNNIDRVEADARDKINAQSAANLQSGLVDALYNGLMSGRGVADSLRDYFKQVLGAGLKSILTQAMSGLFNGAGGGFNLGSLFGGGSGGGFNLGSLFGGGGSLLGQLPFQFGAGPIAGGTGLAGLASSLGLDSLATGIASAGAGIVANLGTLGTALSSGVAAAGGFAAVLGAAIPVVGAIVAIASALGVFDNATGIKIDNSVRDGRGRKDIVRGAALGDFDVSGDIGNEAFKPLITKVNEIDSWIADNLLSTDALAKVRENIQRISSDMTDWFGFDDEASAGVAIGKASKRFLQQRYGTAFDEIDAGIAATIRGFEGSADELIGYLTKVMQLNDAFEAIVEVVPFLNVSLGDFVNASDEARNTLATLAATLQLSTLDIAAAAQEAITAASRTVFQTLALQTLKVMDLADAFDGSLVKAQELAQAEAQRLQLLQGLLVQIAQFGDQINTMFTSTAEQFRLATMDASEKYSYFDQLANDTFASLQTETDPQRLRELAEQYNSYLVSAFNLLTPEQQREQGGEFATLADKANAVVQAQLEQARTDALAQAEQTGALIRASIATAMQTVVDEMHKNNEDFAAAVDKFDNAVKTPVQVTGYLDVSDGQRVPLDQQAGALA